MEREKKSAVEMARLIRRLTLTINVLDSDLKVAADNWKKDPTSQFWRRTLIRCLSALAEGTLGLLKGITVDSAMFFDSPLNDRDIEIATERRVSIKDGIKKWSPKFLPFSENVKQTFKVFTKAHATEVKINYEDPRFADLCSTFELRNKLMHPKGPFDVEVNDDAIDAAERGMKWFDAVLRIVLTECGKKLPGYRGV